MRTHRRWTSILLVIAASLLLAVPAAAADEGEMLQVLSVLSVTAAVSPLFGLLGTVTGIIKTFGDLSFHGAGEAQFISAGISEALITTEYGLVVAIPAFIAHAILSRRAKSVLADMEKLASGFVSSNKRNV